MMHDKERWYCHWQKLINMILQNYLVQAKKEICSIIQRRKFETCRWGRRPRRSGSAPFQNSSFSTESKAMSQSMPLARTCTPNGTERKIICWSIYKTITMRTICIHKSFFALISNYLSWKLIIKDEMNRANSYNFIGAHRNTFCLT